MPIAVSERSLLERCLSECKRKLDEARADGNELQEALCEDDMNKMLEKLSKLPRGEAE